MKIHSTLVLPGLLSTLCILPTLLLCRVATAFHPSYTNANTNAVTIRRRSCTTFPNSRLHPRTTIHVLSSSSSSSSYTVQVTHQNITKTLSINHDESILQALERHAMHDQLSLPSLPQECRRGNCLTCSGKHLDHNVKHHVEIRDDGLSPSMHRNVYDKGLVPTCSSYVVGEGVHLELGVCDDAWREIYTEGKDGGNMDMDGERIRSDAVAKAMRLADERNLNKWALKTEKMLDISSGGSGSSGSGNVGRE